MLESILKRYPELTENDVMLVDSGNGVEISVWKSSKPKPTIEEVKEWVKEDYKPEKSKLAILEDEVNWLKVENQLLKQKIKQLEEMIA